MNCDTLNDRLLDLLYEEMPEAEAREAEAHVSGCASCQEAFQELHVTRRLLSTLPEEEPSRSIDAAILAAARQKVGAEPARPERRRDDREIDGGGMWASILRWLTGFAGSPQFVMATVMMLVVAVGLWYLPGTQHEPTATGGTVVAPDTRGEAAPSAQLSPAEPLELDLDERTGRIRARDESGVTLAEQQGPAGRQLSPVEAPEPAAGASAQRGDVPARELADLDEMPAMEMDIAGGESFGADGERGSGAGTRSSARPAPSEPSFAHNQRDALETQEGAAPADDYAGAYRQQARPSVPSAGASADMAAPSAPARTETEVPAPNREEMMPEAIHRRAQNYARANACQTAISEYRSLLSNYPRYTRRAEAMIELADCQARLGQLAAAETTLRQVERDYPRSAPAARSRRTRVEARRRAADRPASQPASAY